MTAVLLVLAWFGLRPRAWRAGLVYALIGAVVYGTILVLRSEQATYFTALAFAGNARGNALDWQLQLAVIYNAMFMPLWLAVIPRWRGSPPALKRLTVIVAVVYLPLWATLAQWSEVRLLMPLVILSLPMLARSALVLPRVLLHRVVFHQPEHAAQKR